jgi:hypothetical protein
VVVYLQLRKRLCASSSQLDARQQPSCTSGEARKALALATPDVEGTALKCVMMTGTDRGEAGPGVFDVGIVGYIW